MFMLTSFMLSCNKSKTVWINSFYNSYYNQYLVILVNGLDWNEFAFGLKCVLNMKSDNAYCSLRWWAAREYNGTECVYMG